MKRFFMALIVLVLLGAVFTGCSSSNISPEKLVIKGFYLGMPYDQALEKARAMGTVSQITGKRYSVSNTNGEMVLDFICADGQVCEIRFYCELFNSCAMPIDEFIKEMINNYKIPELKIDNSTGQYVYRSNKGLKVSVGETVLLEKVAPTS
ncbi:MAG: hypothetical protein NTW95_07945 [Candidatus Aminicenantes bacterium]|nr:hypothetical protein [Candidatus Aminicenantes bacterium]